MEGTSIRQKIGVILEALYYPIMALLASFLIGSVVILLTSSTSPLEAYGYMFKGAFGSTAAWQDTIIKAIPFVFTALSFSVARRCGIINLGAEGQFIMGALFSTIVAVQLPLLVDIPRLIHLPLTLLAGFLGGALYGLLVAVLKVQFGASELITTIMLNYVANYIVSYAVNGPLMEPGQSSYPQSAPIPETAALNRIFADYRLHTGLIILILCLVFYYFYQWKTTKGFEARIVGFNPSAGEYAGINIKAATLRSLFIAGGLAGLGGCVEMLAVQKRLMMTSFSVSYGFTGIAVALLGSLNPIGILISGILFGGLSAGSLSMEVVTDVRSSVALIIQAFVILFIAGRRMFTIKRKRHFRYHPVAQDLHGLPLPEPEERADGSAEMPLQLTDIKDDEDKTEGGK
ncbi:MAG: ABC transporter permease [Eubacteriales bacterium]|nr:ABC transporter permease [Eubacteriales bacterium]MDD4541198.1 ABC transporter permease [Eubacteriales bacterium]